MHILLSRNWQLHLFKMALPFTEHNYAFQAYLDNHIPSSIGHVPLQHSMKEFIPVLHDHDGIFTLYELHVIPNNGPICSERSLPHDDRTE